MRAPPLHSAASISTSLPPYPSPRAAPAPPDGPSNAPTDRATYVFSTRTDGRTDGRMNHLPGRQAGWLPDRLAGWLACAPLAMLLLCHQIGASPAPSCLLQPARPLPRPSLPASLARSLARQTEKAKRRREKKSWFINPATVGLGRSLAYLSAEAAWRAARVAARSLRCVMSTCLNSSSTEKRGRRRRRRKEEEEGDSGGGGGGGGGGYLPQ